jgi:DNA-binding NtrC family response regulator
LARRLLLLVSVQKKLNLHATSDGHLLAPDANLNTASLAIFTNDATVAAAVKNAADFKWSVRTLPPSIASLQSLTRQVFVLVFDDGTVDQAECFRILEQHRRRLPQTAIIYVADDHSQETERRARTVEVVLYLAKPVSCQRLRLALDHYAKLKTSDIEVNGVG